jgi:hypothetical protein
MFGSEKKRVEIKSGKICFGNFSNVGANENKAIFPTRK